jgi:pimeloyl-ACP methyl ester carboxylesterase
MAVLPIYVVLQWIVGLFSLGIFAGGAYMVWEWYQRAWEYDSELAQRVFDPNWGWNSQTALLAVGLGLLIWSLAGRLILQMVIGAFKRGRAEERPVDVAPAANRRIERPDGSEIEVEMFGPADAPPIVLVHGWSLKSREWNYLKRDLGDRHRLIAWDLPGLGQSKGPQNHDYSLDKYASDLEAVLELAGEQPAVLLGHSIGGMIILTFCRLFPKALGKRVRALILVHTTYTNPLRTTTLAPLQTALERPLIRPFAYLTIGLFPLVWLMNWMGYLNGSSHLATIVSGFTGRETWNQVELVTRPQPQGSPAVLARGTLGMLDYDATKTLAKIHIPTLVVAGDRDPLTKAVASEFIAEKVAGAQLKVITPGKHMGLVEEHAAFAQLVEEFVAVSLDREKVRLSR